MRNIVLGVSFGVILLYFMSYKASEYREDMRRARMEACFSGLSDASRKTFNCDEFKEIQKPI